MHTCLKQVHMSKKASGMCHETTARAARLEQGFPVTLIRPDSNVQVFLGFRRDILEDFATLPRMKGQRGSVHDVAW